MRLRILRSAALSLMSLTTAAMFAVTSMHEHVHERTREQQQIRKNSKQMSPLFREQEKGDDREKYDQHDAPSRSKPTAVFRLMFVKIASLHARARLHVGARCPEQFFNSRTPDNKPHDGLVCVRSEGKDCECN
jgi:hypothetical protein